jgi:tRNA threonylcarbamoyladenosine biosynthesis protein TsaB
MAAARVIPVHPVSSLAALAAPIHAPRALPLIDARRGEVFGALYHSGEELVAPFVTRPEDVAEKLGEHAQGALAAGDGSLRFRQVLEAAGVSVAPDGSELHVVRALSVCRLAASAPAVAPEAVLPVYLREPDAHPTQ